MLVKGDLNARTVNVKWSNLTEEVPEIFIFQLVNFDYFVVKNDHSLVTFNNLISHFTAY